MKQLIYLVGGPGSGKSTLMARLTADWVRIPAGTGGIPRDYLLDHITSAVRAVELGRRREHFSGTDSLSMSIIGPAIDYMIGQQETDLVFGEGARLGCERFLRSAAAAGYSIILGFLEHPFEEHWRNARARATGRAQHPVWVAGRITAARNLANTDLPSVTVISGSPDVLYGEITGLMQQRAEAEWA